MYKFTSLEEHIARLYKHIGILHPCNIDLLKIAAKLNVWIHFSKELDSKAISRNGLYSIIINENQPKQNQWEDFGHELCHILNHEGNQLNLPPSFVEFQEQKANNFMLHFCVPTFMLRELYLPPEHTVEFISETFNVTYKTAKIRLEMYQRQLYQHRYDEYLREVSRPKTKPFNLADCSDETKRIMYKLQQQLKKKELVYNEG